MTYEDRKRLKRLCYLSKRGFSDGFSVNDFKFSDRMLKRFPEEYRAVQKEASDQAISELTLHFKT